MPKDTRVEKIYTALTDKGMPKGRAAAIAQAKSGESLKTGKPPKKSGKKRKK